MALSVAGCTPALLSPPAASPILESSEPLRESEVAIEVASGAHAGVFGPEVFAGRVGGRTGLGSALEAQLEAGLYHIETAPVLAPPHPNVYVARMGVKWAPVINTALLGGVGGGYSAAGGFMSPDLGGILAYENEYITPFLGARAGLSLPIAPRTLDLTHEEASPLFDRPELTWIVNVSLGAALSLPDPDDTVALSLPFAIHFTELRDNDRREGLLGFGIGLRVTLRDPVASALGAP